MVERKFETKIKVVQSDGGMKFHFLTKLGFVGLQHKIIYPYTSFQNNVMEPRNHKVLKKRFGFSYALWYASEVLDLCFENLSLCSQQNIF